MEITVIKTFKDGNLLISSDKGTAIVTPEKYDMIRVQNFDMQSDIIQRLSSEFKHCKFEFKEIDSREHLFMDGDDVTNLSIGSLEFWITDQRMTYEDVTNYMSTKIMPSITSKVMDVEMERCKNNIEYFAVNYVRNKDAKD